MHPNATRSKQSAVPFFDRFTKVMLAAMFVLLLGVFSSAWYMSSHKMEGAGTDDVVNKMASKAASSESHPFIELPGDAELGAFSVANFFVGMIVGHYWTMLFGKNARKDENTAG